MVFNTFLKIEKVYSFGSKKTNIVMKNKRAFSSFLLLNYCFIYLYIHVIIIMGDKIWILKN
jgi:hypothetical protein